jgi:hypothetical protein
MLSGVMRADLSGAYLLPGGLIANYAFKKPGAIREDAHAFRTS